MAGGPWLAILSCPVLSVTGHFLKITKAPKMQMKAKEFRKVGEGQAFQALLPILREMVGVRTGQGAKEIGP